MVLLKSALQRLFVGWVKQASPAGAAVEDACGGSVERGGVGISRAKIPGGLRIYAIGDLHGKAELFDKLIHEIEADRVSRPVKTSMIVTLGDYVDRGLASCALLDRLSTMQERGEIIALKGNHDAWLLEFLVQPAAYRKWARLGGAATLASYGIRASVAPTLEECKQLSLQLRDVLPEAHVNFLQHLLLFYVCGDYVFVHAGLRPGIPIERQSEEDLCWIRSEFLECREPFDKMVVHGHTPVLAPQFFPNRINIDTGAYATRRLTCLALESNTLRLIGAPLARGALASDDPPCTNDIAI